MTIIEKIQNWNGQKIAELRDMIAEANIGDEYTLHQLEGVITDLPFSHRVPDGVEGYPVWTVDAEGDALVGDGADQIEPIQDVVDGYDE